MPGGLLSHGVYQTLGGERDFGEFWRRLGLPTLGVIALCYVVLVRTSVVSQKAWLQSGIGLILAMAVAVYTRVIY